MLTVFKFPSGQIVQSYKTSEELKQILQNLDIYVTPVINVDGYIFSWANDSVSALHILLIQLHTVHLTHLDPTL